LIPLLLKGGSLEDLYLPAQDLAAQRHAKMFFGDPRRLTIGLH
jgi:hypothetical protein